MKKLIALLLALVMVFALAACGPKTPTVEPGPASNPGTNPSEPAGDQPSEPVDDQPAGTVQGVSDTEILVGNTAATTGAFAMVGVPFNAGLEAALKAYNDAGGFHGKSVRLIHYDDGFDAAQGMTYTKTLAESDKVFALVGHFGTNTVGATLDYIKGLGIPMVYAATGISGLYQEGATGKDACVFSVQPIYNAEGRVLLARALASTENGMGLGGKKIGVISTTDDAGEGILAGIKRQAEEGSFDITYQEVQADATDYSAAVNVLKNAGCDVVIAAMNQDPVAKLMPAMRDANFSAKVITSYVSASAVFMGTLVADGSVTADRPIYATSWMDIATEQGMADYGEFAAVMLAWEAENGIAAADTYSINSYAMAGYVAAQTFIHGLNQLDAMGKDLTWENYIAAMENAPFHIPMGGDISFAGGDRLGVTDLALNTVTLTPDENGNYALETVSPITSLDDVWASVG